MSESALLNRPAAIELDDDGLGFDGLLELCKTDIELALAGAPCQPALSAHATGGKLLRPLILFCATGTVGGEPTAVVPAAAAAEILHAASLVHDDIIDGSPIRRGKQALHLEHGADIAVVLGDLLLIRAFTRLTEAVAGQPAQIARRALAVFGEQAALCCAGEIAELQHDSERLSSSTYVSIAGCKTGSQFVAAAALGGLLGGGTDEEIAVLQSYADALGVAFQASDDLDDLAEDSEEDRGHFSVDPGREAQVRQLRDDYVDSALEALGFLPASRYAAALASLAVGLRGNSGARTRPRRRQEVIVSTETRQR